MAPCRTTVRLLFNASVFFDRKSECLEQGPNMTNFAYKHGELDNVTLLSCSCDRGTTVCPKRAEGPTPPKVQLASHDILANLTGRNISDYLMKTNKAFYKKRYGGFQFGVSNPLKDVNITSLKKNLALILEVNCNIFDGLKKPLQY
jgi:hypothetical protein